MKVELKYAADGASGGEVDIVDSPFEGDYEIESVPDAPGPSRDELSKQFEALKADNEALKLRADQAAGLSNSFNQLGDRLEKVVSRPAPAVTVQQAQKPGESAEEFKERLNRKYLEDPYEALVEFNSRMNGGVVQTLAEQNAALQRKVALIEHPDRDFVTKYREEILQEFTTIPLDQQIRDGAVINRVIDSVKARHIDDLIAIKVQEALSKAGVTPPAPRAPVGGSEVPLLGGAPATPPSGPKKIQISEAKAARIRAQMSREGMPQDKFNDYVRWLNEDGELDKV